MSLVPRFPATHRLGSDHRAAGERPGDSRLSSGRTHPSRGQPGDVTIYPTATVGYESGTYNGQRRGGVYTAAGVGVGIGDPGPAGRRVRHPPTRTGPPCSRNWRTRDCPRGKLHELVAGYLYLPQACFGEAGPPDLSADLLRGRGSGFSDDPASYKVTGRAGAQSPANCAISSPSR